MPDDLPDRPLQLTLDGRPVAALALEASEVGAVVLQAEGERAR
jgi:hypothetical protein